MKLAHHSPSSLNLFCASPAMFILEKVLGRRQPVGAPAHRGTAVEAGVTAGLMDPAKTLPECIQVAEAKYDAITALSSDTRRAEYRDTLGAMVTTALEELRPYGVPSHTQGKIEWRPEGLSAPILGYFDFHWADHNITVDLKTTGKMPSAVKIAHARQVALYVTTNNADARATYVTDAKKNNVKTYGIDNINDHRAALHQIALRVEKFLALSDDPAFFTQIIAPDYESFYWGGPARQIGFETWGF